MPPPPDTDETGAYVSSTPPDRGERFATGELLVGRYRIVAPLGKGGMGEVYRADDLTLGQPVALKFLPPHLTEDPGRLARFRKEVALARRVSHPNVCRVYDIAEHEGQSFLTMEFIDGEDLSSVLKRLGRPTEEKSVEMARQLCGALAAVHDQGLLHRDLKPANIMVDGRGRIRLTDFGLAAVANELTAAEVRSGTPMYQAPEQLSGKEVTVRSDLYALGLVLYELATGRRAYAGADRDTPPSKPSSHVSTMDPAVERVILKCLESDPVLRPRSTMDVLAGLPGGDPLAAALAEGQTPSPRLVANADTGEGRLRPWVALALVVVIVAGVVFSGWLCGLALLAPRAGMREAEPALMRHKAREVLAALGHDEPAADSAYRYFPNREFLDYTRTHDPAPGVWDGRWRGLEDGRPPAMTFFYRAARRAMAPTNYHMRRPTTGQIDQLSPPPLEPGMADVTLDMRGRLLKFHKVADYLGPESRTATPSLTDWRPAFTAAGLDYTAFAAHPVPPRHQPPLAFDSRVAWEGPFPDSRADRVRVEAASLGGKPVYFTIEFPWEVGQYISADDFVSGNTMPAPVFFVLILAAAGLGWWNWRAGRADLPGAAILGGGLFVLEFARWALTAHHVSDDRARLIFSAALGPPLYGAVIGAVLYLALEPIVRKRWPWRLVGWNRLLAGRVRDPLVARDVLVGLAAGVAFTVLDRHANYGPLWAPELLSPLEYGDYEFDPTRCIINTLTNGVIAGLMYFFVLFLCHWVCRDYRLGTAVSVLLMLGSAASAPDFAQNPVTRVLTAVPAILLLQFVTLRYGLLAFVCTLLAFGWMVANGWSLDVRAWYATGPNLGVTIMIALTLYAAYTAVDGGAGVKRRLEWQ